MNGTYFFTGTLQTVSILSGISSEAKSSVAIRYEPSGSYVSQPFNWNQLVTVTELTTESALNEGTMQAFVELSADNFATVVETIPISLRGGMEHLKVLPKALSKYVRVHFALTASGDGENTPAIRSIRLAGSSLLDQ